jgi:hypothetical protein
MLPPFFLYLVLDLSADFYHELHEGPNSGAGTVRIVNFLDFRVA